MIPWHRKLLVLVICTNLLALGLPATAADFDDGTNFDGQLSPSNQNASGVVRLEQIGANFRVRHFEGQDSAGFQDDATTFEMLRPFWVNNNSAWFLDSRLSLTNDTNLVGTGGFGFRHLNAAETRTLGASVWLDVDGRYDDLQTFYQLGLGIESLGELFDFRANFYKPIDDIRYDSTPVLSPVIFQGFNLVFDSTTQSQVAMEGLDLEVGTRLPFLTDYNLRGSAGYYYFQADGSENINGFRGRLEVSPFRDVDLMVMVQNDKTFDTTGIVAVSWTFSHGSNGWRRGAVPGTLRDRMERPVERNYQILVDQQVKTERIALTDPALGSQLRVFHVDSNATPGGDGTFEMPFTTLDQAGSQASNIIFAHADSIFNGSLTLQPNQRFLGEGVDHLVSTVERGTILLPRATAGTNRPIIQNSGTNAVVLAPNTEVAGFQINNTAGRGIFGLGLNGNVTLRNNRITNSGSTGVFLSGIVGDVNISDTDIVNSATSGLQVTSLTGDLTYTGGAITGTTGTGVALSTINGDARFDGVDINYSGGRAVDIFNAAGGTVDFTGSTITNTGGTGVLVTDSSSAVSLDNITITNAIADAVTIQNNTGIVALNNLNVTSNTVGARGLVVANNNRVDVTGTSSISTTGGAAVDASDTILDMTFANLQSTNSNSEGISLDNVSGDFTVTGGTSISNSRSHGISVTDSTDLTANFQNTTSSNFTGVAAGDVGHGVFLDNNSGSEFTFDTLNISTDNGGGLIASNSGSITTTGGDISATGGPAVDVDLTGLNLTLGNLTSTDSVAGTGHSGSGIHLDRVTGTFRATGTTTISDPAGAGIEITNVSGSNSRFTFDNPVTITNPVGDGITLTNITDATSQVQFGSATINGRADRGIDINNVAGTINFANATVNAPMGGNVTAGISIENSTAATTFTSATVNASGGDGIRVVNHTGTVLVDSGTINNAAGAGLNVEGGNANITVRADINNNAGRAVRVSGTTGGSVNLPSTRGVLTDNGGTGVEISNAVGNVTIANGTVTNSTSTGITILGGTGDFTFQNFDVIDAVGTGVNVDGGTATVVINGDVTNSTGRAVAIQNTTGGSVTFSGGLVTDNGGQGILIQNANSDVGFANVSLNNTVVGTPAIDIQGGNGTYDFGSSVGISGALSTGISINNSRADITFNGGSIIGTQGDAINILGGAPNVAFSGNISNTSGRLLSVQNLTGGSVGIFGGSLTDVGGTGILVSNNAANINVSNANIQNSTGTAVTLTNNTRALTFSNLDINTTLSNQVGLTATGNTGSLNISNDSTVATANATAVQISGVSPASRTTLNTSFVSVSATGAGFTNGIVLSNVSNNFTITGTGAISGSGGTINGASGNAINITNAEDISLNLVNILNSGGLGVNANSVHDFTMTSSNVSNSGGVNVVQTLTDLQSGVFNFNSNVVNTTSGDGLNWNTTDGTLVANINGNIITGADEGINANISGGEVTLLMNGNNVTGMGASTTNGAGINLHTSEILNATVTRNTIVSTIPGAFRAATDSTLAEFRLLLGEIPVAGTTQTMGNTVGNDKAVSAFVLDNTANGRFELSGVPADSPTLTVFSNGNRSVDLNANNDPDNGVNVIVNGNITVVDPATVFP